MRTLVQGRGTADPAGPARLRERQRAARHRAFLDTARRIVTSEGQTALTMQRVTDELGTSVGGIYLYFPTKDALLAELEAEALEVLHASFVLGQSRLDDHLGTRTVAPATAALARAVATARFWIDAESTLPAEVELSRRVFAESRTAGEGGDASPVEPAALRLLEAVRTRIAGAASAGALDPDDDLDRAVIVVAAVNGVLLGSQLRAWDEGRLDGRRLAGRLVDGLFVGWGATREGLDDAARMLDDLGDRRLAPVPAVEGRDQPS